MWRRRRWRYNARHARPQPQFAMIYRILQRAFPAGATPMQPRRIVFIRPCCIGDVVMATAALTALREAFPNAHISFAVGAWSARAIEGHPALDAILDTGADLPWRSPAGFWRLVRILRRGRYDTAVSLVRSPLMSLAVRLAGIPLRAGMDSGGRGFGYNLRVAVDPDKPAHEAALYLRVASAVAGRELHAHAHIPVEESAQKSVTARLHAVGIDGRVIVAHPGGGSNPGADVADKRYPPADMAALLDKLADETGARVILLGGQGDAALLADVARNMQSPCQQWAGELSFAEIGALAAESLCYIGNDSGLTHLAAACGAKTVMLMRVTDPRRYAPYTPDSLALDNPESPRHAVREILAWLQMESS